MTPTDSVLVLFRDDLRVADNPALHAAVSSGNTVTALFVLDEVSPGIRPLGGASRWWLHESLQSLRSDLAELKIPLVLRRGPMESVVSHVATECVATAVLWNRRYGRAERAVDSRMKTQLRGRGIRAESFAGSLLFEPWTIRTGAGTSFSVFTPFWRACLRGEEPRAPVPVPAVVSDAASRIATDELADWHLQPSRPDWAAGLKQTWAVGERPALARLHRFLTDDLESYARDRDNPAEAVTSRLSPHLRWGEIGPHQIWDEIRRIRPGLSAAASEGATRFLTELGWREFSWHVLFHFPQLATLNWRAEFDVFPWTALDRRSLSAWQTGRTGFPLVDAGMRELWRTGTMHNRVRMVAASFLTKNLLIDWREGEQWFWDTLVDADAAANPFNWQWVAGSGADAAPYFRIFNPRLQAAKFDPHSTYVRSHVPELGTSDYPHPIVDLVESRRAALAAYETVKAHKKMT